MMGDHEPQEQLVCPIGRELAQASDLLWGCHARHEAIYRVTHPRHSRLLASDRQASHPEPALHDTDLALLGEGDVCGEEPHVVAVGLVPDDLCHLYGLGVVDDHVASEASLRGVI